jgi:hypothetical protein
MATQSLCAARKLTPASRAGRLYGELTHEVLIGENAE